jgi:2-polyprenyl-6-hydroxyphenyl methylase/3-demethylubiquinone-9 3-methyltransferase
MTTADQHLVTAPLVAPPPDAFRFGRNWQRYVARHLDPDRERIAAESLAGLVGDIRGKRFIDIGCGSGLFSLCAYRAGASEIVSIDVDPDAVSAARQLHEAVGSPQHWRILHRSILDRGLVEEVGTSDIVYSWGVLHHTGDMYTAIRGAAELVPPAGLFAIAIYNRVADRWLDSERWLSIKRAYNRAPRPMQVAMELTYALYWLLGRLRRRMNPLREARAYRQSRGMALWTDLVDWLGGYPYEFATAAQIVHFCEGSCGLSCVKIVPEPSNGTGNNQFVFERPATSRPFSHDKGTP